MGFGERGRFESFTRSDAASICRSLNWNQSCLVNARSEIHAALIAKTTLNAGLVFQTSPRILKCRDGNLQLIVVIISGRIGTVTITVITPVAVAIPIVSTITAIAIAVVMTVIASVSVAAIRPMVVPVIVVHPVAKVVDNQL